MMKTGVTASLFSLAGYVLPFMFVLNPAFLMVGSVPGILVAAFTGAIGVMVLGARVAGHVGAAAAPWERAALFATALILVYPSWVACVGGLALLGPVA